MEEALQSGSQSLTRIMNTTLLEKEETETEQFADEYIIMFPKEEDLASKTFATSPDETTGKATYDPQKEYESRYGASQGVKKLNYEEWFQSVTGFGVKRSKTSDAIRKYQSQINQNFKKKNLAKLQFFCTEQPLTLVI